MKIIDFFSVSFIGLLLFTQVGSFYILKKSENDSKVSISATAKPTLDVNDAAVQLTRKFLLQRFPRQVNVSTNTTEVQGHPKTPYCPSNYSSIPKTRPLLCYQCKGEARDRDNICDNTLWHFARKTEQYSQRIRCPNDRGFFCSKVVQEKSGTRITQRGCLGRGPVRILSGKIVPLNDGCVVYEQNGFITTTCLCRKDLCNSTHLSSNSNVFLFAAIFCSFLN